MEGDGELEVARGLREPDFFRSVERPLEGLREVEPFSFFSFSGLGEGDRPRLFGERRGGRS